MQKALRFMLWVLGGFIVLCIIARFALFEDWVLPDENMAPLQAASIEPTLSGGDTVLVLTRGTPGFGDLVRCPDPEDPSQWVIGRIVGVAGDTVQVAGRSLTVNGKTYNSSDACTQPYFTVKHPDSGTEIEMQCARIEMGSGWHFRGTARKYKKSNDKRKRVGEGMVFLLSDNRDIHDDSRDFGTLPADSCKERIVFRLWGNTGFSDSERRFTVIR
ncbi:MAG: signal peptidase I [Deltaproteobacteria bacterium]|nr:signal peptidase I [Deltaproteobacteria bacterium]